MLSMGSSSPSFSNSGLMLPQAMILFIASAPVFPALSDPTDWDCLLPGLHTGSTIPLSFEPPLYKDRWLLLRGLPPGQASLICGWQNRTPRHIARNSCFDHYTWSHSDVVPHSPG